MLGYYIRPLIAEYVEQDLKEWAIEHRKRFEPVPPYPLNADQIREKFEARARAEALTILEQERRNYVEYRTPYMTTTLNASINKLKGLVYGPKGKIRRIRAQKPVVGSYFQTRAYSLAETPITRYPTMQDVFYADFGGSEILDIIDRVATFYSEFQVYVPYMSPELRALWDEAEELASLETIEKKDLEKETETAQKTA